MACKELYNAKFIDVALFLERLRYTREVYEKRGEAMAVSFLDSMMDAVANHSASDLFVDLG